MNFPSLLLLSIIWPWSAVFAQTSSSDDGLLSLHNHPHQINHNASLENRSNGITGPWPLKQHGYYKHRALRTVHGTVNIVGWGVLLPTGVIIARYLRESTNDWYNLHIMSQLSGFLLGTFGWGIGISIKNEAKEHGMSTHGILGTIIFAFATLQAVTSYQLLGMCLQPDEEHKCHKYWVMYHNFVGYALILLIIANIFQGISNIQNAPKTWNLLYGAVLGVLGVIAVALEVLRWIYV